MKMKRKTKKTKKTKPCRFTMCEDPKTGRMRMKAVGGACAPGELERSVAKIATEGIDY
jgi:hypothetical protein